MGHRSCAATVIIMCRSAVYFEAHKTLTYHPTINKWVSVCDTSKKCLKCKMTYYKPIASGDTEHTRAPNKCPLCSEHIPEGEENHRCHMQPSKAEKKHSVKCVFYDFETFVNSCSEQVPYYVKKNGNLGVQNASKTSLRDSERGNTPRAPLLLTTLRVLTGICS